MAAQYTRQTHQPKHLYSLDGIPPNALYYYGLLLFQALTAVAQGSIERPSSYPNDERRLMVRDFT